MSAYLFISKVGSVLCLCHPLITCVFAACEKCKPRGGTKTEEHHSWAFYDLLKKKKAASVGVASVQCTYKSSVQVLFFFFLLYLSQPKQIGQKYIGHRLDFICGRIPPKKKKKIVCLLLASLCPLWQMGVSLSFTNAAVSFRLLIQTGDEG